MDLYSYSLTHPKENNNKSTPNYIAKPDSNYEIFQNEIQEQGLVHKKKKIECVIESAPNNQNKNSEFLTPEHYQDVYYKAKRKNKPIERQRKEQLRESLNDHSSIPKVIIKNANEVDPSNIHKHKLKTITNNNIVNKHKTIKTDDLVLISNENDISSQDFNPSKTVNGEYHGIKNDASENIDDNDRQNTTLLCKTINCDGEAVKINNEVVKNKIILSCYPRQKDYFIKPSYKEVSGPYYSHPQMTSAADAQLISNVHNYKNILPNENSFIFESHHLEPIGNSAKKLGAKQKFKEKKNLLYEQYIERIKTISDRGKNYKQYEEQNMKCKHYKRIFTSFLWCLFVINLLLILIGTILLLKTLSHILFHTYINTIIGNEGFVTWVWLAMVLSLLIIVVGVYGAVTAVIRARMMIILYVVIATITAILVLVFLLILWFVMSSMNLKREESMKKTMSMYRCHLWVQNSWDDLQRNHQCCGLISHSDWKYIPPSCCAAHTKVEKLSCISHYINHNRAYKEGCGPKVEHYFLRLFIIITCLLIIAFICLILGIWAAMHLRRTYKLVLSCKDIYRTGKTKDHTCFM